MCRLYGFIANELTKVDCSLVYAQNALMMQSRIDERGIDHADGWGIATYQDGVPAVQKRTTAAFKDQLFSTTAEKTYSKVIVAHVRKATVGANSIVNTHPFLCGNWTFAHNGTVTGFADVSAQLEQETDPDLQDQRKGETDSEQYFLWLLSRMRAGRLGEFKESQSDQVIELLMKSVAELANRCQTAAPDKTPKLNFVLTDGSTMIACRWNNSLHMVRRKGLYDCEICGIPHIHHSETANHSAVAIASEPVTHENWQAIDNESVVIVSV